MKFCPSLPHDINFEPTAIQPCCNIRELGALPRFPFTGGRVDMRAYARHIGESLAAMQGERGMCAGCLELRDLPATGEPPRMDVLFRTVSINKHRHACNCRCVYCSLWKKNADSYDILPPLKSLKAQRALHQDCLFSWGGGEPSILKEFEEASQWIFNGGYRQYVHTNALRYSPSIASLLKNNAGGVNISLDSGTPETYAAVKGVNGFARARETLGRYIAGAANPRAVHVKYIVFEANNSRREIDAFGRLCRESGVRDVQWSFNFLEVNAGTVSDATLKAALYLMETANALDIACAPFFVDQTYLEKMCRMATDALSA